MDVYVSTFATALLGAAIYKYFTYKTDVEGKKPPGGSNGPEPASKALVTPNAGVCVGMEEHHCVSYDKVTGQPKGLSTTCYICTMDTGAQVAMYHKPEMGKQMGPQ